MERLSVLYEDNHLIAVDKPAGIATMGTKTPSLLGHTKSYIKRKYQKPGNVYLGVVSRLDAPVTGVVLFARTSKAAARLSQMFRDRKVDKIYRALVSPAKIGSSGTLEHWLIKNEMKRRMQTCRSDRAGAKLARLNYQVLRRRRDQALVDVELLSGRKHQIRVQFAAVNCPIVGDRRYGSSRGFSQGIALHARRLSFEHPVQRTPMQISAPLPPYWPDLERAFSD